MTKDKIAYIDVLSCDAEPAVVSIARRIDDAIVTTQLVRDVSLTPGAIATALDGCSAAVTMEPDEANLAPLLTQCPNLVVIRFDPVQTGLISNPFSAVLFGSQLSPTKTDQSLCRIYAEQGAQAALDELLKGARERLDTLVDVAGILRRHSASKS